ALHFQPIDEILRDDDKQRQVNGINAFAQDHALAAALADRTGLDPARLAVERARILEVIAGRDSAQRLARLQRLAVARVDVSNLSLRDRHEWRLVNPILPAPEAKVHAAAQQIGLITRFAVERENAPFGDRASA